MALTSRKKRPLVRDSTTLRDDRLFIVACDDTYAPKQYFGFLRISRVQIHVIPTTDGSSAASHVLDRLLEYNFDDGDVRWLILDTDHYSSGAHLKSLKVTLRRAKQLGVHVAMSKPCFELWLLLHHVPEPEVIGLANADETVAALRENLGSFNKTSLNPEHFPTKLIPDAYVRAKRLDRTGVPGDPPIQNTSRVYRLLEQIAGTANPTQLPLDLQALVAMTEQ